jgi:SAM-dependent methyltransferase
MGTQSTGGGPYASPREVTDLAECYFYHTIEIPGVGLVEGPWDLRGGIDDYLGRVDFRGKRVLELGTASGFACFHMESRGAEVIAYDLGADLAHHQNVVPFARSPLEPKLAEYSSLIHLINNGYWFCHRAFASKARVVYGSVYEVPRSIGVVDVAVFGSILLHLRDPFQALSSALRLVRETVVLTEPEWFPRLVYAADDLAPPALGGWRRHLLRAAHRFCGDPLWRREVWLRYREELAWRYEQKLRSLPAMVFVPDHRRLDPADTWWHLSPPLLCEFLGVLGFEDTRLLWHTQLHRGRPVRMFTIVGHRSVPPSDEPAVFDTPAGVR